MQQTAEIPLARLGKNTRAQVVAVRLKGPVGRRLRELGFVQGARVTGRNSAPLGDARVYEIAGANICLRRAEARAVQVRPAP